MKFQANNLHLGSMPGSVDAKVHAKDKDNVGQQKQRWFSDPELLDAADKE